MPDMSDFMKMFSDNSNMNQNNIGQLLDMFQNISNSSSNTSQNSESSNDAKFSNQNSSFEMPDFETIMKIQKIMGAFNSNNNDPSANLLLSLKPYLRNSKKDKVDQYIKMIGIFKAMSMFNDFGGDSK